MRSETDGNQEEEGPELGLRKTESAVQCVTDTGKGRGGNTQGPVSTDR